MVHKGLIDAAFISFPFKGLIKKWWGVNNLVYSANIACYVLGFSRLLKARLGPGAEVALNSIEKMIIANVLYTSLFFNLL